jgi:hypothetical protein
VDKDVEVEVAASFGPFVVLFCEDGAGETDQGAAAGEDPGGVGAAADLPVQSSGSGPRRGSAQSAGSS